MRTGRRRKSTVTRDATTGRSRGPTKEDARAVAMVYRTRDVGPQDAADALAGFSLGKLRLRGRASPGAPDAVSEPQYLAGEAWARLCHRHSALHGYSLGVKSNSMSMIGGTSLADPPSEDVIASTRRQWRDCYGALMDAGVTHRIGTRVALLTWDVCVDNRPVETMMSDDFGVLRLGLNALHRILG